MSVQLTSTGVVFPDGTTQTTVAAEPFSAASNGYQKLASGLIIQWGSNSGASTSISFPIVFPNACVQVIPSFGYNSGAAFAGGYDYVTSISASAFTVVYAPSTAPGILRWVAFGF